MYQKEFIVNVDGCSFGRSVKTNYSWLPKGRAHPIINSICKGSANILLGILIDGKWLWMILDWSNTSYTFGVYLFILKKYIEIVWDQVSLQIKVMLDNASVHLTKKVKRLASHLSLELNYLPPYWPHLAPVELVFGAIKKRISCLKIKEAIDFDKPSGKKIILNTLRNINTDVWIKMWGKFIFEAKQAILETHQPRVENEIKSLERK